MGPEGLVPQLSAPQLQQMARMPLLALAALAPAARHRGKRGTFASLFGKAGNLEDLI